MRSYALTPLGNPAIPWNPSISIYTMNPHAPYHLHTTLYIFASRNSLVVDWRCHGISQPL